MPRRPMGATGAMATIDDGAWTAIAHTTAILDEDQRWILPCSAGSTSRSGGTAPGNTTMLVSQWLSLPGRGP
jgi:hypothetical protein